ncbi:hypothetical protein AB3R30_06975 [Leptolyngbyaceae cyanobacterium UHCC 1019]
MIKPDFNAMSKQELKAYVLQHRDALDALEALFSRRSLNARVVRFPFAHTDLEWQQQQETLRSLLEAHSKPDSAG